MDKFLQSLLNGQIELDAEKARPTPLRTRKELEAIIKKSKEKPRGAKPKLLVEIDDEVKTLKEWAEFFGIKYYTLYARYKRGLRGRDLLKD